jgi:predicted MFS family arabinose efflux permease
MGFVIGTGIGAVGAGTAAVAILNPSFWLFTIAMVLIGAANAFGQQYRFAAADAAEPGFKPRAIAWVMAGGVVTGVLGPQMAIYGRLLTPGAPLAGPFLALIGASAVTALVLSRLVVPPPPPILAGASRGRPLHEILLQPRFLIALLAAVASYALMSFVMTATPLAMLDHHHSQSDAQIAIQWHVIAMFAPSFVTGRLIARYGASAIVTSGLLLIAVAATIALAGTSLWHFWGALILLGLGWNFGFIAATAMVAGLYRPEEAFRVQAMNDFILFSIVAVASFSSGSILVTGGWTVVNLVVYPVVAVSVLLVAARAVIERRQARTA